MTHTVIGVVDGSAVVGYSPDDDTYAEWHQYAIEYTRGEILTVPGSGNILGVWAYNGTTYAFRNNEAGDETVMYKSSGAGWALVATPTLLPDGNYRFRNYNFSGHSGTNKMYGVDGVNQGFQFDGTTFTQITTGMVDDTPIHLIAHKYQLFYAFSGGSVQHSSPGNPVDWSPITGAAELAVGAEITGFETVPGNSLAILCRNRTFILQGSGVSDWNLITHSLESGAIEDTIQNIGAPKYLDDRGMTTLDAVQDYGDFAASTFSKRIWPVLNSNKNNVGASVRVKEKDHYRIYFKDGTGVTAYMEKGEPVAFTRTTFPLPVLTACSAEQSNGDEIMFFGSDDGFVYQLDAGTSFDGGEVEASIRLPFNNLNSPRLIKAFKRLFLEIDSPDATVDLRFTPDFDYGDPKNPTSKTVDMTSSGGGGYWDSAIWGEFVWDGQIVGVAEGYISGSGLNLGVIIRSNATYERPHTIQGVILHYSVRGFRT